jgi:transcriptional regulator with XRE-family HTH domain
MSLMTQREIARRTARGVTRRERPDERVSELDKIRSDPRTAAEVDAARLEHRVASMLARAAHARTDLTHREIAEILGVTEGRVSQVLSGEETPRLSTLARYMSALGYLVDVRAEPHHRAVPDIDAYWDVTGRHVFVQMKTTLSGHEGGWQPKSVGWDNVETQPIPVIFREINPRGASSGG